MESMDCKQHPLGGHHSKSAARGPLKSSHPVASDFVPSPVLNTENHQFKC